MIENKILDFLNTNLDVPAFMEHPIENINTDYVILERTSSSKSNHISNGTFVVQSYAPTLLGACMLDENTRKVFERLIELDDITSVQLDSFYNYTDTSKRMYRYQAVFDITYYD